MTAVIGFGPMLIACQQTGGSSPQTVVERPTGEDLAKRQGAIVLDESECSPDYYTTSEFGPVNLNTLENQETPGIAGIGGERAIFVWVATGQTIGYDGETPITDPGQGIFAAIADNESELYHSNGFDYHISQNWEDEDEMGGNQSNVNVAAKTDGANSRVAFMWESTDRWDTDSDQDIVVSVWTYSNGNGSLTRNANFNPTDTIAGNQLNPAAAFLWNENNFVTVWDDDEDVYFSICNHTGSCSVREQQINTSDDDVVYDSCRNARVDTFRGEGGGFVVVFLCDSDDLFGSNRHVYFKRYEDDGTELDTSPVRVQTSGPNTNMFDPDVACLVDGEDEIFVVVWQSAEPSIAEVLYRLYEKSGSAINGQTEVTTLTTQGYETRPRVTAYTEGTKFAVVWARTYLGNTDIHLRRFDADGGDIDTSTVTNVASTTNTQHNVAIDVMKCDSFAIAWESDHLDENDFDIFGRYYDQ